MNFKKLLLNLSVFLFAAVLVTLFFVQNIHAQAYGDGLYGDGPYNGASPTSSPTPTPTSGSGGGGDGGGGGSSSGGGGSSSGGGGGTCSSAAPGSAPNLLQVVRQGDDATVFFGQAFSPVSSYYIAYGYSENNLIYGVNVGATGGVQQVTVSGLPINSSFVFRVRADNGCTQGLWSNTVIKVGGGSAARTYLPQQATDALLYGSSTGTRTIVGRRFGFGKIASNAQSKKSVIVYTSGGSGGGTSGGTGNLVSMFFLRILSIFKR